MSQRLDGWKAIAAHMNRSVRQCQRLAESSGLPVHHLPGSRAVYAYTNELDAWIAGGDPPRLDELEARISRSGRHVILPVELAGTGVKTSETGRDAAPGDTAADSTGHTIRRRLARTAAIILPAMLLLIVGLHFRTASAWRNLGTPLDGRWTFINGGIEGTSASVGRFDTGDLIGPGTTVAINLQSMGTRWSGGVEIFQDDLHWTYVSLSPNEHAIGVQRFPSGTVNMFFGGSQLSPGAPVQLVLHVTKERLTIRCGACRDAAVELGTGDVARGRLVLRVGSAGDETHEPTGGHCLFRDLQVRGAPKTLPSPLVEEVPEAARPEATYTLTVDNIDDQVDVLIDGRRLASATYRETIGPLVLNPFLTRGRHTLTARLFNRKWTAAYGVHLERDGTVLWDERCGDVHQVHSGCAETGDRLGLVKVLSYTFDAR